MRRPRTPSLLATCAIFLAVAAGQIRVEPLVALDGNPHTASLSPDGKTLVFNWCKPGGACGLYTRSLAGGEPRLFAGKDAKGQYPESPAWSPAGGKIAFLRDDKESHLIVRDTASGSERNLGVISSGIAWSPNGRFLVAGTYLENPPQTYDCRPTLFSAETGARVRHLAARGDGPVFSPDGRKLAYYDGTKLMLLRLTADLRPDGEPSTLVEGIGKISQVLWTAKGSEIVFDASTDASRLYRVTLQPGAQPRLIEGVPSGLYVDQILADGTVLATESSQIQTFSRVDLQSNSPVLATVNGPGCTLGGSGCSPDGRLRAYATGFPPILDRALWVENVDGTDRRLLVKPIPAFADPKQDGEPRVAGWSPDGRWIAYTVSPRGLNYGMRSHLYVVPFSGGNPQRLAPEAFALEQPVWSRDGKSIYAAQKWPADDPSNGKRTAIVRIDVADGKLTALGVDGDWPRESPDGRFLYFFGDHTRRLSRISFDTGAVTPLPGRQGFLESNLAIGRKFLYAVERVHSDAGRTYYRIVRFNPESGVIDWSISVSDPYSLGAARLSPDERYLYFEGKTVDRQRIVMVRGLSW
jgi:Tol biopolymer transport system component